MTPTPDSLTDLGGHQNMPRPCWPFQFFDEVFSQHKPHFEFIFFIDARTCSKSNRKQKMNNVKSNVVSMHCLDAMQWPFQLSGTKNGLPRNGAWLARPVLVVWMDLVIYVSAQAPSNVALHLEVKTSQYLFNFWCDMEQRQSSSKCWNCLSSANVFVALFNQPGFSTLKHLQPLPNIILVQKYFVPGTIHLLLHNVLCGL